MRRSLFFLLAFSAVTLLSGAALSATREVYEAEVKPWSGYWWPSVQGGMLTGIGYKGRPSVLDKLAAISPGGARVAQWYEKNFYKPDGEIWFGLCHAWALAAATEPEPVRGGVFRGVPLSIGEKKALLTLAHANDITYHGKGYDPLVFHQWILRFLKENRKSFVVNLGVGDEVWFYPVYRAEVESEDFADRTEFNTLLWYASNNVPVDFAGIRPVSNRQTYVLYKDDQGQYIRGVWTEDSISQYPKALWSSLERQGPPSFDMDTVAAAVRIETDDLSGGYLRPGSFNAFFDRTWTGQLEASAGEWLELEFSLASRQLAVTVHISDGVVPLSANVTQATPRIRYRTRTANPMLTISPGAVLPKSPFVLRYELARSPILVMTRRDANLRWAGIAGLSMSQQGAEDVLLVTARAKDGRPLRSEPLHTGHPKFSHVIELPSFDSWALGRAEHFEITFKNASHILGLSATSRGMSAFSGAPGQGMQAVYGVIPDKEPAVAFYIRNHEPRPVTGIVRAYDDSGRELLSEETKFAANELKFFSWGAPPLLFIRNPGLFSIDFGSAKVSLEACFVDRTSMEMVPAAGEFSKEFLLSHYPNTSSWASSVHILNSGNSTAEVGIETMDGRRLHTVFVPPHCLAQVDTASLPVTGKTLRVRSNVEVAAHVRYQASGEDWALLPLSRPDQTREEILVPHLPDAPWWAGVILDNANAGPCEVVLEYFGASGEMLRSERRVLDAYEPWVFTATRSPETAYLKIRASAPLGCGVLYGSDNLSAVAGYTP